MTGLETATLLLFEALCGAAGTIAAARLSQRDLGWKSSAAIGALGGVILTFLATRFPDLARLVGHVESAMDAISRGTGGLTFQLLAGAGVAGLLGGVISIGLVGLARRANLLRR